MKPIRTVSAVLLLALTGLAVSASGAWATSPPNDDFADAIQLTGKFQVVDSNTISSTVEPGEPVHQSSTSNQSVWFKWTAPADGSVILRTCGPETVTRVQAYTGTAVNSLSAASDGACRATFDVISGTEYHFAVYPSAAGNQGFYRLSIQMLNHPANDDFANAEVLSGNRASAAGTTAGATVESGEPAHNGSSDPHTVWYKWTAPGDGVASYDICRTEGGEASAVYTGASVGSLTLVSDSYCGEHFPVTAGTTYYFAIAPIGSNNLGGFYLRLGFFPGPPVNDDLANAQVIAPGGGEFNGTTGGATTEVGEIGTGGADATVWYSWTPATSGVAVLDSCSADNIIDVRTTMYLGSTIGGLSYVAGGNCRMMTSVIGGTTYRIQLAANNESDAGDFTFEVSQPAPPANDNLANAVPITTPSYSGGGIYTGASRQPSENDPVGNGTGSVWYSWTAPSSDEVTIDTCGSDFDTYLALFSGSSFPLSQLAYNDDSGSAGCGLRSSLTFNPTEGLTYRIGVYAYSSFGIGHYKLRLNQGPLQPVKYTVKAAKTGTGNGTVFMPGSERIYCGNVCTYEVNDGASIQMTAVAEEGSEFLGWKDEPACPGLIDCNFNVTANHTITAIFKDVTPKTLTVNKGGNGKGTVVSTTGGIDCGTADDGCSQIYDADTVVTLTQTPSPGSRFTGWSGACTGTGACQVTMDDEKTVVANFALITLKLKTGKARLNRKKGTALLPVTVNEPARITLSGKNVKKKNVFAARPKTVKIPVRVTGKLKRTLRKKRKATAKLKIRGIALNGGSTATKTVKVTLKLKKKRRK